MNRYLLIIFCAFISLLANAQQDNMKYLAGAVPEVEGKIVFQKSIAVKNAIADDRLFDLMDKWAKDNYEVSEDELKNRILLSDSKEKSIACSGEKYMVFKKSALVLDRAKMLYQLILSVERGRCDVTIRNIKYDYSDSKKLIPAEEMISDNIALNKKGDKLNRYYDKFRIQTVDSVNSICRSIDIYLNGINTEGVATSVTPKYILEEVPIASAPEKHPIQEEKPRVETVQPGSVVTIAGFKQVSADKIPGNYIKLLNEWTLITSGTAEQINVMTASWGGLGMFWEKPVAFCFLNPTRYSVQTMDKGETYTISFYTEAYKEALKYCGSVSGRTTDKIKGSGLTPVKMPSGAMAFSEAWMILECRKIVAQPISSDAVVDKTLPGQWSKDGYHKMYIGEILNVWIK